MAHRLLPLLLLPLATACVDKGLGTSIDSGTEAPPPHDSGTGPHADPDTTPDDPSEVTHRATLRGSVIVEPVRLVDGQPVPLDDDELASLRYPYGALFIAAQDATDDRYLASDTVLFPAFTGNTFELPIEVQAGHPVRVFAALDDDANAIVSSDEPMGVWPAELEITDGEDVHDLVIRVVVDLPHDRGDEGGTDAPPCDLRISGDVVADTDYEGGGLVMLLDTEGRGPSDWAWFTVADGAGTHELEVCPDLGPRQLVGAIDDNHNGLIDPMDTTGAYVTRPDTTGNPIHVGTADLTDLTLQLPIYGEDGETVDHGISLVPFVRLSGTVMYEGGTFDTLDPGTRIVVVALKYRPNTSASLASLESSAYDTQVFEWADLEGRDAVDYALLVPGGTDVFLWAYADPDLDGTVNEVGEPVASADNSSSGHIATGTTDQIHDMVMGIP